MKRLLLIIILLSIFMSMNHFGQFHDYSIKYGIQGHLLQPSTEFDNDAYRLSLMGRGFLRYELNSYLETELGVSIGELNGKDFNNQNWSTLIFPADLRIIYSPIASNRTSPYIYSGMGLLRWNISDFPTAASPQETKDIGWNLAIPLGGGIEIYLSEEILLDISGGYTFTLTDNLNYFNQPTKNDGYYDLGFGLTFVMGGSLTDIDNDGLTQKFEIEIGTTPDNKDTDGDNITDGDEVNLYKTNPLNVDTDSDELNDFDEINTFNTDPKSSDTDGDDISDYDELELYKSNPTLKDSDSDELSDGYELNIYNTNPNKNDTDNDKLLDNEEIHKYKTDPNNPDTDGDGLSDGEEILKYNTNPLIRDAETVQKISDDKALHFNNDNAVILRGITFALDKADIETESELILNKAYNSLLSDPSLRIEIRGFTDNVGKAEYNKKLSQQRADAVKIWLVKKGIDALRINAVGYGESNPIASNKTKDGRIKNRRIEIIKID